jgi:hypothetical protein
MKLLNIQLLLLLKEWFCRVLQQRRIRLQMAGRPAGMHSVQH